MGKVHINVRISSTSLDRVDRIAEEQQTSRSAAVDHVLAVGLQAMEDEEEGRDSSGSSPEVVEAMKAHISMLHEQLTMKDEQIARLNKTADQAQELQLNLIRALPAPPGYVEARTYQAPGDAVQGWQEAPQAATTTATRPHGGQGPAQQPAPEEAPHKKKNKKRKKKR